MRECAVLLRCLIHNYGILNFCIVFYAERMKKTVSGWLLFEALIAWFVLSCFLLSMLLLSIKELKLSQHNYHYAMAVVELHQVFVQLRLCATATEQSAVILKWRRQLSAVISNASGDVNCKMRYCHAAVLWQDSKLGRLDLDGKI